MKKSQIQLDLNHAGTADTRNETRVLGMYPFHHYSTTLAVEITCKLLTYISMYYFTNYSEIRKSSVGNYFFGDGIRKTDSFFKGSNIGVT